MYKTDEVKIYGDVNLSEEELDLLGLGPGYMVVAKATEEDMRTEANVALTKMRWQKMKEGREDMTNRQAEEEDNLITEEDLEEENMLADELDKEVRDVLSENREYLDMRKRRATDMKINRKVMMPAPCKPLVEAEYNLRGDTWQRQLARFRQEECNEEGVQRKTNLTVKPDPGS